MKRKFKKFKIEDIIAFMAAVFVICAFYAISATLKNKDVKEEVVLAEENITTTTTTTTTTKAPEIIWDGLTLEQLAERLNKNLYDTMEGTGIYFANYTKETGLDPYLAVSIINLETGCKWGCSYLAKNCNNIGGLKGSPSCNGGSYMKFDTLEEGIRGYLDIVYNNYWKKGLTTPELMNPKYAASNTWAEKVNRYYEAIKAS